MFQFNFGNSDVTSAEEGGGKSNINWYESQRVNITPEMKDKLKNLDEKGVINMNYEGNITLSCLSSSQVIEGLKKESGDGLSDVLEAEKNHSDLIPGKYEGGLKIWECTRDLVNYLIANEAKSFKGKIVLDLGCGAGILGILALLRGASVTFQDYNCEVLNLVTIPNVFLNTKSFDAFEKTEFYSGDWKSFLDKVTQSYREIKNSEEPAQKKGKSNDVKFDYILSSETIYNCDNYDKIYQIVKALLKDDGVCYIAAKKCYFGVGGNIQSFIGHISKENVFHTEVCWSSNQGIAREVLKITFQR